MKPLIVFVYQIFVMTGENSSIPMTTAYYFKTIKLIVMKYALILTIKRARIFINDKKDAK